MVTMNVSNNSNADKSISHIHNMMKRLKFLEEDRKNSFKNWQYEDHENCSVEKMAQAGFYYSGQSEDDDSATCFVCGKVLDGWESSDNPWQEHEKHAPNCQFVKIGLGQANLTTEQFLNLAANVIKAHATSTFNKKLSTIKKRADEIRDAIKNQHF